MPQAWKASACRSRERKRRQWWTCLQACKSRLCSQNLRSKCLPKEFWKAKGEIKMKCPDCSSKKLKVNSERGETVCINCGLVIEENMVQEGPEWRAFDAEQRASRARAGAPLKYMNPNRGLVTEIDQYNRDTRGGKIAPAQQAQLYRMRKWHKRASISNSIERNLAIALTELNRVASHLGLPEIIRESSALLYRKCVEKGLIRGRQIESVVSAVTYAICRKYGIPRTLDEIATVAEIPKKEIG